MSALPRLTEADLDARELERITVPADLACMQRGCSGACFQGRGRCDCIGGPAVTWRDLARWIARPFAIAWLRWEISSHEQWIAQAQAAGILGTNNLLYCHRELQRLRVRLALWEAQR